MPPYKVPAVVGVPGRSASKLDWWTPSSVPLVNYPEDPNWLECFSLGDGGMNNHVQFRASSGVDGGQTYVYLSWVVLVQPTTPEPGFDGITVLIGDNTNQIALKIRLHTAFTTLNGDSTAAYTIESHSYAGGTLGPAHAPTVPWAIQAGRVWIDYPSPIIAVLPTPVIPWAFQLRVPVGVNLAPSGSPAVTLPLTGSFKLWYQLSVVLAVDALGVPTAIVAYPWPMTPYSLDDTDFIPSGLTLPDVGLPGTPGVVSGVTLDYWQIGIEDVTTGALRGDIQLDLTGSPPDVSLPQHQNMFYARPSGITSSQKPNVTARFRLANWGLQYEDPTANSWKIVPGGEAVLYQAPTPPFGVEEFRFRWPRPTPPTSPDAFTLAFINGVKGGTQNPHQCMMVEMFTTDPTVVYTKSSSYNNLRAVNASTFSKQAEVSIVGVKPLPRSKTRDVYLHLQIKGMPKVVNRTYLERMAGWLKEGMPPNIAIFTELVAAAVTRPKVSAKPSDVAALAKAVMKTTIKDILNYAPSYQVHGYYDTGDKLKVANGAPLRIFRPLTSFGYVVSHQGALVGYENRLYGATPVSQNLYAVQVPNKGSIRVNTALQARVSAREKLLPLNDPQKPNDRKPQ